MMEGWKKYRLEDVCTKVTDGTHDTPKAISDGIPLIKGKDIANGYLDFVKCDKISISEHKEIIKRSHPEFGDILFANIGNSIGDCLLINTEREFSIKNVALFKPNIEKVDYRFLYYVVKSQRFYLEIWNRVSGAAQPFASLKLLRNHKINLPPLKIQSNIASILSAYDDLIENNLKRIKLLEEQAQQTYEEWFVRFKFPGYETAVFDEESGLPVGWEVSRLDNFAEFKYGKMPKKETIRKKGFPVYSGYRITGFCNDFLFENPTLIIVARGVGGTGDVKITPAKCWLTNLSIAVLVKNGILQSYLFYYLKDANLRSLDSGAAQSQITITSLEPYPIRVPNKSLQIKFDIYYKNFELTVSNLKTQNQLLKEARDILLPRLMSGMIDPSASSGQVVESLGPYSYREVAEGNSEYKNNQK